MQVVAVSTPRDDARWLWRIVNNVGKVVEESRETFSTIASAVEHGSKRLRQRDVDNSVRFHPYRTLRHVRVPMGPLADVFLALGHEPRLRRRRRPYGARYRGRWRRRRLEGCRRSTPTSLAPRSVVTRSSPDSTRISRPTTTTLRRSRPSASSIWPGATMRARQNEEAY